MHQHCNIVFFYSLSLYSKNWMDRLKLPPFFSRVRTREIWTWTSDSIQVLNSHVWFDCWFDYFWTSVRKCEIWLLAKIVTKIALWKCVLCCWSAHRRIYTGTFVCTVCSHFRHLLTQVFILGSDCIVFVCDALTCMYVCLFLYVCNLFPTTSHCTCMCGWMYVCMYEWTYACAYVTFLKNTAQHLMQL